MKDLITAGEFHGPFFYGLSILKKRSKSFCALSSWHNGPKFGVLFDCSNSNNLMYSDLKRKILLQQANFTDRFLRPQYCKKTVLGLLSANFVSEAA